jgi:hypothetical protein
MPHRLTMRSGAVALAVIWALGGNAYSDDHATAKISTGSYVPVYPLKVSSNNRYLVDQSNVPFMLAILRIA